MAKHSKKRKHKATRRRRRSVGALSMSASSPLMKYGPIALGFFLAAKINAPLDKMIGDKVDGKIVAGGQVGLGYMLALGPGKKSLIKSVAGGLLLGSGAKRAMTEFGIGGIGSAYGNTPVVAGAYGNTPVLAGRRRLNGYSPNRAMNGYTPNSALNGNGGRVMAGVDPGTICN